MTKSKFCSIVSRESREPIAGSAPFAEHFVFISWPKKFWGYEALEAKGGFPKGLKTWIKVNSKTYGKISIRLVSRAETNNEMSDIFIYPGKYFYPKIIPSNIPRILDFHFQQGLNSSNSFNKFKNDQIFICTHGRHDKCCSKYGQKLAEKMRHHVANQNLKIEIWESSHLGGHRFAATLIDFPNGHSYGRLSPEEITIFFEYRNSNKIYIPAYRGSVFLSELEKVAEANIQHYCFAKKWFCNVKIKNIEIINENKFSCIANFNFTDDLIGSQHGLPKKSKFSFVLKEFKNASGCDSIDNPELRKCWIMLIPAKK